VYFRYGRLDSCTRFFRSLFSTDQSGFWTKHLLRFAGSDAMREDAVLFSEDERDLLTRAAAWPDYSSLAELTGPVLAEMSAEQGIEFATALLYDRLRQSERHGAFIRRVDELLDQSALKVEKLDLLVAVAPGAFYRELPRSGADGAVLRQHVSALGCRTAVIPIQSMGTVAENGRIIRDWLADHAGEKIALASLSKGAADVKAALAGPDAATTFRSVVAWLNLSGLPNGTPLANWVFKPSLAALFYKAVCWCKGLDCAIARQLAWGSGSVLDFPLTLPTHIRLITVAGFPLRQHFTQAALRRAHGRIAPLGPNDGFALLADACALPGVVYPVWGADHTLRPTWDIGRLVEALAFYLAETLILRAHAGTEAPCPSKC
jgi:hypothetical protein